MLFKSPQCAEVKRLQGVYISEQELRHMLLIIRRRWNKISAVNRFKFVIKEDELQLEESELRNSLIGKTLAQKERFDMENKLFAKIVLWTLEQNTISCNMLMGEFNLGWKRANRFIERLNDLEIVGDLDAKLPRTVLPQSAAEISEETIRFLESNGCNIETISVAINNRS